MSDSRLRSFIDRVLRLKEEQDALAGDIREIYAEAKGEGFDKTAMGQLVSYLRKREKDGDKLAEQSAIFDLYLEAYERPSHAHTREGASYAEATGREPVQEMHEFDPETGEITDNQESDQPHEADAPATAAVASDEKAAQDDVGATASSTNSTSDGGPEGRKRLQVLREPTNAAEPDVGVPTRSDATADRDAGHMPTCALTPRDDIAVGTNSHSQATPSKPANTAEEVNPSSRASSATHSDPYDPGPIPAFLDRRQPKAREWEEV